MTQKTELLSCPFCGGNATLEVRIERSCGFGVEVEYPTCQLCGAYRESIDDWNTRAKPDIPDGYVSVEFYLLKDTLLALNMVNLDGRCEWVIRELGKVINTAQKEG